MIESTDELGNDLAGVMTLQRRLSGLERDLAAIQAKVSKGFIISWCSSFNFIFTSLFRVAFSIFVIYSYDPHLLQLDSLQEEADRLKDQKPEEAEAIQVKINEMTELWTELKTMVSFLKSR